VEAPTRLHITALLLAIALASAGGCVGMRAGEFSYETDLDAAHQRTFRGGWQAEAGVQPLWSVGETGCVVRAEPDGIGDDEERAARGEDVVGYEARLATYGGFGLLWYRTRTSRWADDGKPSHLNERTAILGGLLASNEVIVHRWQASGAPPHVVHDWRFLLGFVGYREEPGRRVVTILGLPIPLPWDWE
jgi:hypothetical protein